MNILKVTIDLPEGSHTSHYAADMMEDINWTEEVQRIAELVYKGNNEVKTF